MPSLLSVLDLLPLILHSLHSVSTSPPRSTIAWVTFALRSLLASSLCLCGLPVPITRDAAISHPPFTLGSILRYFHCGCFPKGFCFRRLPGCSSAVVQLDAVCDPGASASHSSLSRSPHGLLPARGYRHFPNLHCLSGLCLRFRAYTLHLVTLVYSPFGLFLHSYKLPSR